MKKLMYLILPLAFLACSEDNCDEEIAVIEKQYQQVMDSPNATEQQKREAKAEYEREMAAACD